MVRFGCFSSHGGCRHGGAEGQGCRCWESGERACDPDRGCGSGPTAPGCLEPDAVQNSLVLPLLELQPHAVATCDWRAHPLSHCEAVEGLLGVFPPRFVKLGFYLPLIRVHVHGRKFRDCRKAQNTGSARRAVKDTMRRRGLLNSCWGGHRLGSPILRVPSWTVRA